MLLVEVNRKHIWTARPQNGVCSQEGPDGGAVSIGGVPFPRYMSADIEQVSEQDMPINM